MSAMPVNAPKDQMVNPFLSPVESLMDRSPYEILASIPAEDMERTYRGLSLFRPNRPVNGVHIRTMNNTGICIGGEKFYFRDSAKERKLIAMLTDQSEDFGLDILQHLRLGERDFQNIRIIDGENGFYHTLIIGEASVDLYRPELYLILHELSKYFANQRHSRDS
jgi:hypothetical protein